MLSEYAKQFLRHPDTLSPSVSAGAPHPVTGAFGERDPRHFVVEKLGVTRTLEWQDADENRYRNRFSQQSQEVSPDRDIVNRLRHHEVRPGRQLGSQPPRLFDEV